MQSRLPTHEWIVVTLLILIMVTLTVITHFQNPSLEQFTTGQRVSTSKTLEVSIDGAVANPGIYKMRKGSTLADLFELAIPYPEANLKRFKETKKVKHGDTYHIPRQPTITIYVEGAVHVTRTLEVPKGTRLQDIITMDIPFLPEADLDALKKRRILKDQETIQIASRKEK